MHYRRSKVARACYFFTLVTYQCQHLLIEKNIDRLCLVFKREMQLPLFTIDAIVILADQLHTLWQLPEHDYNYSLRLSNIKRFFSLGCEKTIRDQQDWQKHMDYIHYNPAKHRYVKSPTNWPYSSFKQCVDKRWYQENWGLSEPEII